MICRIHHLACLVGMVFCVCAPWQACAATPLEWKEHEVVVFLGGANTVSMQKAGYLEALLTQQFARAHPIFRDLSWESDTVFEQGTVIERWREQAHFDEDGGLWDLNQQLKRCGATMIFAQFGQSESMEGEGKLSAFTKAYEQLIESWLQEKYQVVLLTPTPFEGPASPHLPNLALHNRLLAQYVEAIKQLGRDYRLIVVDLFHAPQNAQTDNGRHLLPEAHPALANQIAAQLGVDLALSERPVGLRQAIIEKHQLWLDYWRPTNWKLLFGDDARRHFTTGPTSLRQEWASLLPLIEKAERRIDQIANNRKDPGLKRPDPEILHAHPEADISKEQEAFTLPEGFSVNLFASEAQGLTSPLNARWDPAGHMYVTVTTTYPHAFPGARPDDKIIRLVDSNQDGFADHWTVFADGLNIPTGIEWGHGGIYVGQHTELLFLKDTDGDGRADERKVLLSGFGDGDSHQTINSFIWSPDGQLYFGHGDGCESRVETPLGTSRFFNAGYFKLRPNRLKLIPFLEGHMGPGNPWGIGFDPWGQGFGVDGAGGISWLTPAQVPTTHRRRLPRIGKPGGYCGITYLDGQALPASMRGSFAIGDYKANRVSRFSLSSQDSGFLLRWEEPLLSSSHRNFRPVDVKQGPDGAIYVVDWYNPITCHQDDAFRDPTRDKAQGRIWRVSANIHQEGSPPADSLDLLTAPLDRVVESLTSPDAWTRYQAKRALTTHPEDAVEMALERWVNALDEKASDPGFGHYQGLMAFATMEVVRPTLLKRLLKAPDARVRAGATKLIGRWHDRLESPLAYLSKCIDDPDPRVRLEAIVSCAAIPSEASLQIAVKAIDHEMDSWMDYALRQTIRQLSPHWLPTLKEGHSRIDHPSHLAFILNEMRDVEAIAALKALLERNQLSDQETKRAIISILAHGDPKDIQRYALDLKAHIRKGQYQAASHAEILEALCDILTSSPVKVTEQSQQTLLSLAMGPEKDIRVQAIRLLGLTRCEEASEMMVALAIHEEESPELRAAAIATLGKLHGPESVGILGQIEKQTKDSRIRSAAILALADLDPSLAAKATVHALGDPTLKQNVLDPLVMGLTQRPDGTQALVEAILAGNLPPMVRQSLQRTLFASGITSPKLLGALNAETAEEPLERAYDPELVSDLVAQSVQQGNPLDGETIYQKLACNACHQIKGEGGMIGPDLSSIGSTLSAERMTEELLWPGRQIKEGFVPIEVHTKDNRILIGYERKTLERPGENEMILRNTVSAELMHIDRENIQTFRSLRSMMPENLTQALSEKQLADLIAYLAQLRGKS